MVFFEGYTDGMKRVIFLRICSVNKSVCNNIFFITNGFTDEQKITDERFTDGALITDRIRVLSKQKNFVGKPIKCYSVNLFFF
jgi:hypothetical protein